MEQYFFDQNPSPMLIFDVDSLQILKANKAFSDKYKYNAEDIEGGLSLKKIMKALETLSPEGISEPQTHRHQIKEGDIFHVKVTSVPVSHEEKNARLVMLQDISDQVAAEQKLAQTSKELRYHISKSPLATIGLNPDLEIMEWSPRAEEISGYSKEEVLDTNFIKLDIFDDTERIRIKEKIKDLVNNDREKDQFETKISRKNGGQVYIKVHSSVRRGPAEEIQSILSLVEDVTELKKSEIKYQRLFENANDSILIIKDGLIQDCNKKAEALFKTSRENIIGKSCEHFSPEKQPGGESSRLKAKEKIESARDGDTKLFEWQYWDTEGTFIDVEISLNEMVFPDGKYLQAIIRDMTRKKKIQAELRKNEELFRNLFLKSPTASVMVDEKNRVQLVNERFENMFGYNLNEITGKNLDSLLVPSEELEHAPGMQEGSDNGNDFQLEGVRLTKAGEKKDVIIVGMLIYVDDKPVAGLGTYIDITDRKKVEKRINDSLDKKQFLLEEIHHRLKNDLSAISSFVQLKALELDDEQIKQTLEDTQLHIESVAMVHQLLYQSDSFSRILLNNYIGQLLEAIREIFAFDEHQISINFEPQEAYIPTNKAIPCAMLINELLTNAYKHAFTGRKKGNINVIITTIENKINVEVSDDGVGLPDDFDLTGDRSSLGINLIGTLAEQIDADLTYSSSSSGTVFRFSFIYEDELDMEGVA